MNDDTWRYYGISAVLFVLVNVVLTLNGMPRVAGMGWIIWTVIVVLTIQKRRSARPKGEDLVKEAREQDSSWTEADKQAFRDLMQRQRRG